MHASPTCVMAYGDKGGAVGYLVGAEHGGMAAMFTMMNNARIGVGVQGLALWNAPISTPRLRQNAHSEPRFAQTKKPPVAIINHPDVRRMLLTMKAHIEAARALAYSCAYAVDVANARR